MVSRRVKQTQIWASGGKVLIYIEYFVKCASSVWGHAVQSNFRWPCISKTAGRRVKRTNISASEVSLSPKQSTFDWSVWDHLVHFQYCRPCIYFWLKSRDLCIAKFIPCWNSLSASDQAETQNPCASCSIHVQDTHMYFDSDSFLYDLGFNMFLPLVTLCILTSTPVVFSLPVWLSK